MLNQRGWEKLYEESAKEKRQHDDTPGTDETDAYTDRQEAQLCESKLFQMHNSFIITSIKSGLLIINQQLAHQRILYERFVKELVRSSPVSQRLIFPISITLTAEDMITFSAMAGILEKMGFHYDTDQETGEISFSSIPADMPHDTIETVIEVLMNEWNEERVPGSSSGQAARFAKVLANRLSVKTGTPLSQPEMQALVDQLFQSEHPETTPGGKQVYIIIPKSELEERFNK
jgi:DNA mismatch repair protein MutL